MKTALIFLIVAILILVFLWTRVNVFSFRDATTIDIHVHDTYYVIDRWFVIIMIILFPGTLSSLGGVIGTGVRNKFFLIAFIIFVIADLYIVYWVWSLFKS